MSAKIFQIIDEHSMLVGVEDPRNDKGTYSTLVMVKCSTKGLVDDKFYPGSAGYCEGVDRHENPDRG